MKVNEDVEKYIEFGSFEEITNYYEQDITNIFNKYSVIQNQSTMRYFVIQDPDYIQTFIEEKQNGNLHQMFGDFICPCIDIDCQSDEYMGEDF